MKKITLIVISILGMLPIISKAQGFDELVLQLSQPYSGGTARMLGIGGSKVALGADAGNIYVNPAGLGFYNRSEWVFSPSLNYISTNSDYLNSRTSESKLNFNFANLGLVFNRTKSAGSDDKWRGGSFAFSFNRINSFHSDALYQANNVTEDIIDYAVWQDNNIGTTDLTDLLYNVGVTAVFQDPETQEEFVDRNVYRLDNGDVSFPEEDFPVFQREEYQSSGAQYATSLAYGGNYDDKIYLGGGLNVLSVDKQITRTYSERPTNSDLTVLTLTDKYNLTGTGLNLNLGIIARPAQSILLGFSYTSPTWYGMEETREYQLQADFVDETTYDEVLYPLFTYNLRIPSKIRGGITYFFGKNGFISADIESTKTANSEFSNGDNYDFSEDNDYYRQNFERTIQAGVGGEYRMDIFRFRAGVNYTTSPVESDIDFSRMMYSVGAGIRQKNYFVDFAYNQFATQNAISPYPTASLAEVDYNNNMFTLSVGFTF